MKKIIVITVAISFVATLILVWGGYKVVKVTRGCTILWFMPFMGWFNRTNTYA
ncbi:MAG: hypothetical protein ACMV1K_11620 [Sulfurospirillum sp.]